jgi:hypothetical protein
MTKVGIASFGFPLRRKSNLYKVVVTYEIYKGNILKDRTGVAKLLGVRGGWYLINWFV